MVSVEHENVTESSDRRPFIRAGDSTAASLSPRQVQILTLVAAGLSNKEIARKLRISPKTVESHLQRLYDRHGVRRRAALVAQWMASTA
ncbi:regulatory LuxR family protein [Prauserella shujinwangii]|uniref:Regulatory LuxR family protein n=1 Tax=Prauserella shujinwangii TaxID=1453103 RepID=A0A2T0M3N1_9PSEU|nr:helix-turn-helix transcriptional regulator [Prauserella shujinwangii]PRX51365.1 regulatory LuxR family protein [Prauserella shujinwangii]